MKPLPRYNVKEIIKKVSEKELMFNKYTDKR